MVGRLVINLIYVDTLTLQPRNAADPSSEVASTKRDLVKYNRRLIVDIICPLDAEVCVVVHGAFHLGDLPRRTAGVGGDPHHPVQHAANAGQYTTGQRYASWRPIDLAVNVDRRRLNDRVIV